MGTFENKLLARPTVLYGLAATGFIALLLATMGLAVYASRFVPSVISRVGTAAVSLRSTFTPDTASLLVVPNASPEVIPSDGTNSTAPAATTSVRSGFPDLIVKINSIGYLATASADSFAASSSVPAGFRPAIRFAFKNIGTEATGTWRFTALIPTQNAYIYASQPQISLEPGESISYVMGFDQAKSGKDQIITVTANADHAIAESAFNNNTASATITILGK